MIIKTCGIRENEDLISISSMGIDYAGFIFVPTSPRDASATLDEGLTELLSRSVPGLKKTGVFCNAEPEEKNLIEAGLAQVLSGRGNVAPVEVTGGAQKQFFPSRLYEPACRDGSR